MPRCEIDAMYVTDLVTMRPGPNMVARRCTTHQMSVSETEATCPIGRIEQAADDAIARITGAIPAPKDPIDEDFVDRVGEERERCARIVEAVAKGLDDPLGFAFAAHAIRTGKDIDDAGIIELRMNKTGEPPCR